MNLQTTHGADETLIEDAALYAAEILTLNELAAKHGLTTDEALARISDPETLQAVEARGVALGQSGAVARATSHVLLRKCLRQLDAHLETGELGATALVRIAEFVHKVSGMVPLERAPAVDDKPKFSVNIILHKNTAKLTDLDITDIAVREVHDE